MQFASLPGKPLGSVQLTVCTRQARMLLPGRKKADGRDIPGLQEFAGKAWTAGRMSACDDPFADYALMLVETAHREVRELLRQAKRNHASRWRDQWPFSTGDADPVIRHRSMRMQLPPGGHAAMALALIL